MYLPLDLFQFRLLLSPEFHLGYCSSLPLDVPVSSPSWSTFNIQSHFGTSQLAYSIFHPPFNWFQIEESSSLTYVCHELQAIQNPSCLLPFAVFIQLYSSGLSITVILSCCTYICYPLCLQRSLLSQMQDQYHLSLESLLKRYPFDEAFYEHPCESTYNTFHQRLRQHTEPSGTIFLLYFSLTLILLLECMGNDLVATLSVRNPGILSYFVTLLVVDPWNFFRLLLALKYEQYCTIIFVWLFDFFEQWIKHSFQTAQA